MHHRTSGREETDVPQTSLQPDIAPGGPPHAAQDIPAPPHFPGTGWRWLDRIVAAFMLVVCWIVATLNPSILGMIETIGGPVIAAILFLMPMYAIRKVPAMARYRGQASNVFVTAVGLVAISALIYSLTA